MVQQPAQPVPADPAGPAPKPAGSGLRRHLRGRHPRSVARVPHTTIRINPHVSRGDSVRVLSSALYGEAVLEPRDSSLRTDPRSFSVLLVEDEQSIAEPFARALERNGFSTQLASTGAEAIQLAQESKPDVVLLDLALPDRDGRDVCRELRRTSDVPIIMVTASGTVIDRVVGLELGADDYVIKPFAVDEVIARIRAVLRRGRKKPEVGELTIGDMRIDVDARRVWLGQTEVDLTRKEFDLLTRLAQDAGNVVKRETLMSDVWDTNWFGSTKTLDVHVAWLRRKLGDDPAHPRFIHTVRGVGFRLADQEEPAP